MCCYKNSCQKFALKSKCSLKPVSNCNNNISQNNIDVKFSEAANFQRKFCVKWARDVKLWKRCHGDWRFEENKSIGYDVSSNVASTYWP